MGNIIVGGIVLAIIGAAAYSLYRDKKAGKGCSGCSGGCQGHGAASQDAGGTGCCGCHGAEHTGP